MPINANTRFLGVDSSKVNLVEKKDGINNAKQEYVSIQELADAIGGGGGLEGTQYVFVAANGTDVENAQELQAAYDLAVTMSPSATNRITVIAAPGNYNFSSDFVMNTQYIDLVSLDGNRSVIFNGTGTISITANNVFVKGVDVLTKPFIIGHSLNLLKVENCKGGDNSFGYVDSGINFTLNGTFIDCVAGNNSFGHRPNIGGNSQINLNINGTFTNCTAGNNSFGYNTNNQVNSPTTLSFNGAKLTNCIAGNNSFGVHSNPTAGSVTTFNFSRFTNCKSADNSFGFTLGNATVQSTSNFTMFENCEAGDISFCTGFSGNSNVIFKNCVGGNFCFFGNGTLTGKFENCKAAALSFGNFETASGTFINCQADFGSFGGDGTASGTFNNCIGGNGSFGYGWFASGTFNNCIGGDFSFGGDGTASGTFTNCIGDDGSFGGDGSGGSGILTGKLYYCRLTSGTFETVSGGGVTVLCIDGNNQINTQN